MAVERPKSWLEQIRNSLAPQSEYHTWLLFSPISVSHFWSNLSNSIQLIQFNPTYPIQSNFPKSGLDDQRERNARYWSQSSTLLLYPCPLFQHYPIWSDPSTSHSTKKYPSYSTQVAIEQLIIWKLVISIEFQWYW